MNHETSPNRCPCPASSSRRDHGSGQQEEIIGRSRGEWFGFRRRCPGHFSLAGGGFSGYFLPWAGCVATKTGRFTRTSLPNAQKCLKIYFTNTCRIGFVLVRFRSARCVTHFSEKSPWNTCIYQLSQSKKRFGLGGTRTHNQRLKRALLYH